MIAFQYIDNQAALDELVALYRETDLLVLDTEFVRTRTYYARLGLIQAYDGKHLALIDPLAVDDLSGFWDLLKDPKITKLVHSCSEDLEVFARYGKCQPEPLFDSQIAAALCGWGHGLGYAKLVEQQLNIVLDKGESRTDWMKRPLTPAQLQYAANDVYYLYQLYPALKAEVERQGRMDWVWEEGKRLTKGRLDKPNADEAYLRIKNAFQLTPKQLAVLKSLATWRLNKALQRDLALGFVMKDHGLIALARKQPKDIASLLRMNEVTEQEKRLHAREVLQAIAAADLDNPPEALDVLALRPGYKAAFKAVKAVLIAICESREVPEELLASKRHIHDFLQWHLDGRGEQLPLLLTGWRGDLAAVPLHTLEFSI
ncbi:ribonuclease D [Shewanella submarina]|uniref:Ribonuclease D n=1 Tax=Shewanella submarina TaxID=2016376 RepID=A0ABV7GD91_9GAMM|nr:ribonuclease D [Shewanella submarina]MCL1039101.1 ribonuclease D [Shewanella submarina]